MADLKSEFQKVYVKLAASHSGESVNTALLKEVYTDDAVVMAPGQPATTGFTAVVQMIEGIHASGARRADVQIDEVLCAGDWAVERSRFTLSSADGAVVESGKQLMVWKKVGGQWKIYTDSWSAGH